MGPEQDSCEDGFLEDGLSGPRCAAINLKGPLLLLQVVVVLPPLLPPAPAPGAAHHRHPLSRGSVPWPADSLRRARRGGPHGRARRDGHECGGWRLLRLAPLQRARLHGVQPPVRHGLGLGLARRGWRHPHRGGVGRLGARQLLARALTGRPPRRHHQLRLLGGQRAPGRRPAAGTSFAGVVSFIFADLIALPFLDMHRPSGR